MSKVTLESDQLHAGHLCSLACSDIVVVTLCVLCRWFLPWHSQGTTCTIAGAAAFTLPLPTLVSHLGVENCCIKASSL